ncbi:bacillithiol biosynthesis deacetylase BshB1 [Paenalkalicoccus suaedae]|uniref:Bacillithiol biosynthesis deacetylase BshB1 n=1 Tax=Paenalkalicoccus suaedae TaxID=2592382 RepID=A0A859FDG1_9BACI|nr:bacillithiol biosynthesis deacetylase BshB1 [Paenalkalicoccus suaedae]QKS71117.1 bacillithiol biosynthesis deacetylase BshB1 [Paenalkalicoccus suaedae]
MSHTDILAVGAHPDDVEIGMGGTLYKYRDKKTMIVHLTQAELSSNGTVATRLEESKRACDILNVDKTTTLTFPDRGLYTQRDKVIDELVKIIRETKPRFLFAPSKIDRHPDHGMCAELVAEAFFNSGIKRFKPELGDAFRPKALYFYQINGLHTPDFTIDISKSLEKKQEALEAFKSQFESTSTSTQTPLNNGYVEDVLARDKLIGRNSGVLYAEGFLTHHQYITKELFN